MLNYIFSILEIVASYSKTSSNLGMTDGQSYLDIHVIMRFTNPTMRPLIWTSWKGTWKDFGICGIIWNHLESFGFIWNSFGSIWDDVGSSAIIWDLCPSRLTWDRLGSSCISWDHLPIHLGAPGGTIWEETSEEGHLENFWGRYSFLKKTNHQTMADECSEQPINAMNNTSIQWKPK